jgi:hypothetical protein
MFVPLVMTSTEVEEKKTVLETPRQHCEFIAHRKKRKSGNDQSFYIMSIIFQDLVRIFEPQLTKGTQISSK